MITIITGVPGSGKTALCVDLIAREYADRPIYNDGLEGLKLENTVCDALNWHNEVPDGALVVVDEVQRKWRPRGAGQKVPEAVSQLETHRHRGLDFIVITQNLKLVDANVRALAGRHLHIRDTGFLGRWLYEWPEADINNNWKRCENKRRYRLPRHVFGLYTSASLHTVPVRSIPTVLWFVIGAVLVLTAMLAFLYLRFTSAPEASDAQMQETEQVQQQISMGGNGSAYRETEGAIQPSSRVPEKAIDDLVDWIPRVSTHPESAPAYDAVRQVARFPRVAGGYCIRGRCVCLTQQGTDAGLGHDDCLREIEKPRFNPYAPEPAYFGGHQQERQRPQSPHQIPAEL